RLNAYSASVLASNRVTPNRIKPHSTRISLAVKAYSNTVCVQVLSKTFGGDLRAPLRETSEVFGVWQQFPIMRYDSYASPEPYIVKQFV
ncbi:MAG: hypothetical protein ACE5FI_14430, partial [Anaerolineales bacterium]